MNEQEQQFLSLVERHSLPLAFLGICLTLYFENTTSPIGIFFVALGFICGLLCGWVGWKKHQQTMQEIESNLRELKEY